MKHKMGTRVLCVIATHAPTHGPGVTTAAKEPIGGRIGAATATARATLPILGTIISSRRGARTASPLPLRGRVAVQFDPKLLYPSGAESLRARERRCFVPSAVTPTPPVELGEMPFAPALGSEDGGTPPPAVR
jgi:hypothetical protein